MGAGECMPWYICRGQRTTSVVSPHLLPCLRQYSHWHTPGQLVFELQGIFQFCLPSRLPTLLYVFSRDLNLDPHTCIARVLSTEPSSLQP